MKYNELSKLLTVKLSGNFFSLFSLVTMSDRGITSRHCVLKIIVR